MATVRIPKGPEKELTLDLATRPQVGMDLPAYKPGSFEPTQPGLDPAAARHEAARCFRCDAVYRCETVHVQSGRGPTDRPASPATTHQAPPLAGPASTSQVIRGGRD